MTRDQAVAVGVAFLDQFIERGAAPDLAAARERLASGDRIGAFDKGDSFAEIGAFIALRTFLLTFYNKEIKPKAGRSAVDQPDIPELLFYTEFEVGASGEVETSDPAQWNDWLLSVEKVLNGLK